MELAKSSSSPGRPRGFDRDAALRIALDLFWRHGFEGVSIADLTRAIGIAPPSLYAAFGSKAALFREAIDLYQRRTAGQATDAFLADGPIRDKVAELLRGAVRAASDPAHPPGCMVISSLLSCGPEHAELADAIAALRRHRCAAIAARLQRAVDACDLPPDVNAGAMARYLTAVMQGIAIQARDGATAAELDAIVEVTVRSLPR